MLETAADIVPRAERKQQPRGWCGDPETEKQYQEAWARRDAAWKAQKADCTNDNGLKSEVRRTCKLLKQVKAAGVERYYRQYVATMEGTLLRREQAGFCTHLKMMDLECRKTVNSQYIKDEEGILLRDPEAIRSRWMRFSRTLLNAKPEDVRPEITAGLKRVTSRQPSLRLLLSRR